MDLTTKIEERPWWSKLQKLELRVQFPREGAVKVVPKGDTLVQHYMDAASVLLGVALAMTDNTDEEMHLIGEVLSKADGSREEILVAGSLGALEEELNG